MESLSNKTLEKLKYDLVRDGIVSYETIEKAQELASAQNINLGQVLINLGVIKEDELLKFLESKLHIPYVNLDDYSLDTKCLELINFNDAKKYKIIPLFKIEDVLTVAMADPLDLFAIEKILEKVELEVEPVISSEKAWMTSASFPFMAASANISLLCKYPSTTVFIMVEFNPFSLRILDDSHISSCSVYSQSAIIIFLSRE